MSYSDLLKDPRWQKKRLEILQRDNWTCLECGDTTATLHVHHLFYVSDAPWMTPDFGLRTLCEACHEAASRCITKGDGLDQFFSTALVLMDELRERGLNPLEACDFAYHLSCLSADEFDAIRNSWSSGPPPPSTEELEQIRKKTVIADHV